MDDFIDDDAPGDRLDVNAQPFTEDALALELAVLHSGDLRYVADWSQWLRWDGTRWQPDKTLAVFDLARKLCRSAAAQCNKPTKDMTSAKTVTAIERMARSDRLLAATTDQWDAD